MSMRYEDPEEAKGIKIYGTDGVEITSDSEEEESFEEWVESFHGSDLDNQRIEIIDLGEVGEEKSSKEA